MVITIFGASGRVGHLVVTEALARGHSVRAFIHHTNNLSTDPHLIIIKGDIHNPQAVAEAIRGSQAVISVLGSWGTPGKDIVSGGMRTIIPSMESGNIKRIVSLTGSGAYDATDKPSLVRRGGHLVARILAGKVLTDGEEHLRLLRNSRLDWTTLRSPAMNNSNKTSYRLSLRPVISWRPISRKAVAKAILDQLNDTSYNGVAPFIHP